MSERTHSLPTNPPTSPRRKFVPIIAGTAVLLVTAGVWLQFFNASPAVSQTAAPTTRDQAATPANSAKILAKVNGQAITYDVLARECVARHGVDILDSMINRLIIQQECERQGVSVTVQDIEQEVARNAKSLNMPVDVWYKLLESEKKLTRDQYQQDIIWPMLSLKRLAGQDIKITEDEMRQGFERDYGPRVKARMIVIEGNLRRANQVWEKCQDNPDDFDRLAREFSSDANTKALGGVIPPIARNGGSPLIEKEAFKMNVGEISPLIQITENRYVILRCEGFTEPVITDIKEVWDDLYAQLSEEESQKRVAKIFGELQGKSRVDNFLTNTSTGGKVVPVSGTTTDATPAPVSSATGTPASRVR